MSSSRVSSHHEILFCKIIPWWLNLSKEPNTLNSVNWRQTMLVVAFFKLVGFENNGVILNERLYMYLSAQHTMWLLVSNWLRKRGIRVHLSQRMWILRTEGWYSSKGTCLYLYLKSFPCRLLVKSDFNLKTRRIPDPMFVQQLAVCMWVLC